LEQFGDSGWFGGGHLLYKEAMCGGAGAGRAGCFARDFFRSGSQRGVLSRYRVCSIRQGPNALNRAEISGSEAWDGLGRSGTDPRSRFDARA
jgi:hypothetical protein